MKIGVITHWGSKDNYGQLLQAFALQHFLRGLGHSPFLIRFNFLKFLATFRLCYCWKPRKCAGWIIHLLKYCSALIRDILHPRHFDAFQQNYMKLSELCYSDIKTLQEKYPEAEAYITGSDMVWGAAPPFPPFFLQFGQKETLRLSYAAGMGFKYPATKKNIALLKEALSPFSFVSVREKQGVEICNAAERNDAILVPDPVFLHTKDFYKNLFGLSSEIKSTLLIYLVGNRCHIPYDKINRFAAQKNLKIKFIASQGQTSCRGWEKIFPTPEEFMNELSQAAYVITNSFHGTAFSVIFQKNMLVIPLDHADSRIDTVMQYFGIKSCIFNADNENLNFYDLSQRTDIQSLIEADISRVSQLLQSVFISADRSETK